ncbi:MAG: heme-binding protein [Acidobacteriota bacterium]
MRTRLAVLAVLATLASSAWAQIGEKKVLSLEAAKQVVAAAVREANKDNHTAAIAIVDDGGNLMLLERLDNTFAAGPLISYGKARTSALFKKPTRVFEEIIKNGRTPMVALNDFTPLQGGVPLEIDGQIVGAIGVSGAASAQRDEEVALAGAAALATVPKNVSVPAVEYFERKAVSAAFAKGQPLLEVSDYKVHASHRDKAGLAEVHARETDVIYVVDGQATFVTGGTVVEAKETAPFETRGRGIDGGDVRKLAKGDVVVVPNGTPHWFRDVNGAFDYFVVKVID